MLLGNGDSWVKKNCDNWLCIVQTKIYFGFQYLINKAKTDLAGLPLLEDISQINRTEILAQLAVLVEKP